MADDVCSECGRPHERPTATAEVPILGVDGRPMFDPEDHQPPAMRSRVLGAVATVTLLIVGAWVLASLGGGESERSEPETGPVSESSLQPTSSTTSRDTADTESSAIGPEDSGSATIASSLLAALDTDLRIGLFDGVSVAQIDLRSGEVTMSSISDEQISELDPFVLLRSGLRVVGIDVDDTDRVVNVGSVGEIVLMAEPRQYSVITPDFDTGKDGLIVGNFSEGFAQVLSAPVGSERLSVPGLGVIVMPPTGGSYLATAQGYELVTDARVLAASPDRRLEQRCDDDLRCRTALVDSATGAVVDTEPSFGDTTDTITLSPDGRWILRSGAEVTILHDTETASTEVLAIEAGGTPRWSPDSSFVAWLDDTADPLALEFALVGREELATFRVGLAALGEDFRPDAEFVLF